jgi:hypothetical protein
MELANAVAHFQVADEDQMAEDFVSDDFISSNILTFHCGAVGLPSELSLGLPKSRKAAAVSHRRELCRSVYRESYFSHSPTDTNKRGSHTSRKPFCRLPILPSTSRNLP